MAAKRLPPVWMLGLANGPLGVSGAIALLITPQLLAGAHVPEPRIAQITGLALVPTFCAFLVSPILDVRFSRRTYVLAFASLGALFCGLALANMGNPAVVGWLLFGAMFSIMLTTAAGGGWLAGLIPREDESKLGAWLIVGNIGGFGLASVIGAPLIHALPNPIGAIILAALVILPIVAIVPFIPAPGPDRRLAKESFGQFAGEGGALVRRPEVLQSLILFGAPAATFALTNTLGGLGHDFGAQEHLVSLVGGAGVNSGGVVGSLLVPPLAEKLAPRPLYLAIGATGAVFTLSLILLPKVPAVFAAAMVGQNVFQAAAMATANVVIFRAIGKGNPFAATQFSLLLAAMGLPLSYMQVIDGHAYGAGGLGAAFLADAGLGLVAVSVLATILLLAARRDRAKATLAGAE
jgi:PAT family beta-lactamase induction signal transducer AmpG